MYTNIYIYIYKGARIKRENFSGYAHRCYIDLRLLLVEELTEKARLSFFPIAIVFLFGMISLNCLERLGWVDTGVGGREPDSAVIEEELAKMGGGGTALMSESFVRPCSSSAIGDNSLLNVDSLLSRFCSASDLISSGSMSLVSQVFLLLFRIRSVFTLDQNRLLLLLFFANYMFLLRLFMFRVIYRGFFWFWSGLHGDFWFLSLDRLLLFDLGLWFNLFYVRRRSSPDMLQIQDRMHTKHQEEK